VLSFKFSVTVVQFLPCQASRLPSHRSPFHHCPAIALSSSAILQRAVPDVTVSIVESIVAFFIVSIVMFFAFSTLEQAGLGVRFAAAEAQIPTSPERMVLSSTPQQAAPWGPSDAFNLQRWLSAPHLSPAVCYRPSVFRAGVAEPETAGYALGYRRKSVRLLFSAPHSRRAGEWHGEATATSVLCRDLRLFARTDRITSPPHH